MLFNKRVVFRSVAIGCVALGIMAIIFVWARPDMASRAQAKFENQARNLFGIPGVAFPTATPESEGMDSEALANLTEQMAQQRSHSFLVIRGGNIVREWYHDDWGANDPHWIAAMAKAVTGRTVLLTAISNDLVALDDPLWKYVPSLEDDPTRSKILLRDLAHHTSGITNVSFSAGQNRELTGWQQDYYDDEASRFHYALNVAPIRFPPGTQEEYSGVGYYALAYALGVSLKRASGADLKTFLQKKIMRPLGVPDAQWTISYGNSYQIDGMKLYALGSGANYTPRASARICELLLNNGQWKGKRIISKMAIDQMLLRDNGEVSSSSGSVSTNHGWTLNTDNKWPSLPRDAYAGIDVRAQIALVVPSLDLIVVRHGPNLGGDNEAPHQALNTHLFKPLIDSIIGPSSRHRDPQTD